MQACLQNTAIFNDLSESKTNLSLKMRAIYITLTHGYALPFSLPNSIRFVKITW